VSTTYPPATAGGTDPIQAGVVTFKLIFLAIAAFS